MLRRGLPGLAPSIGYARLQHSDNILQRVSELLAAAPTILQLFLICGDSGPSPSEASPRRWRAPASGMRARARVRSAEAAETSGPRPPISSARPPRDSANFALRFPARFQEN